MIAGKISQPLAASLAASDDGDWVDVIVELATPALMETSDRGRAGTGRADRIAARKATFARQADPVSEAIRRMGGQVTEQAWINGSLRARMGKKVVAALSDAEQVVRLDVPRTIRPDIK